METKLEYIIFFIIIIYILYLFFCNNNEYMEVVNFDKYDFYLCPNNFVKNKFGGCLPKCPKHYRIGWDGNCHPKTNNEKEGKYCKI